MTTFQTTIQKFESEGAKIVHFTVGTLVSCRDLKAAMFYGKTKRPAEYFKFRTEEQKNEYLEKTWERLEKLQADQARYKAEQKAKKEAALQSLKVGDIYVATWGYDQTNVNFYKVTKVNGANIGLVELLQTSVEIGEGYSSMSDHRMPREDAPVGEMMTRRISAGGYIKIDSVVWAKKWEGKPVYCSWYA